MNRCYLNLLYSRHEAKNYTRMGTKRVLFPSPSTKSLKIPKGNQNPQIADEQITQWPKDKGQITIYKTYV